jgi:hypothetical protein
MNTRAMMMPGPVIFKGFVAVRRNHIMGIYYTRFLLLDVVSCTRVLAARERSLTIPNPTKANPNTTSIHACGPAIAARTQMMRPSGMMSMLTIAR